MKGCMEKISISSPYFCCEPKMFLKKLNLKYEKKCGEKHSMCQYLAFAFLNIKFLKFILWCEWEFFYFSCYIGI